VSRISRKNQVTLPVAVLHATGLDAGDDVEVRAVGPGHLEIVRRDDLVEAHAGMFGDDVYPPGYLDAERAAWR
jgi:bifunctional DNA-binding transcriptional regulator/antitoxin component of YhaV-PrlF toxin-antitoxin module